MIDINFHEQLALVQRLGENLVGQHPSCWDIVLPPGFPEERFARQLEDFLRGHARRPRVAVQGADHSNPTISDFVRALHWQWGETKKPPKTLNRKADIYLDLVLDSFCRTDRPVILVLKRFHKVLDALDLWVLGKLRREEQNKCLHTVVITPIPLLSLKERWEAQGHYFSRSDYGDSRHTTETVFPPSPDDVTSACDSLNLPAGVVVTLHQITGGNPEHLADLLEWWINQGQPSLTPRVRAGLLARARAQLGVFLEWLDPLEDGVFRDLVIDLYHGFNIEHALDGFHNHPWRDVVLDGNGLRSEALGAAALEAALKESANQKTSRSPWYDVLERAHRLYRRKQFEASLRVLETIDSKRLRPHDQVLQSHARIMVALSGAQGDEYIGGDTDCRRLRRALSDAREILANVPLQLASTDRQKIEGRYRQLDEVASAITTAATIKGRFQNRLWDVLAGFAGQEHLNRRGAMLLFLVRAEGGKDIPGDCSACQFVLALPEQIFITWALWALDLNYYQAPHECGAIWQAVEREWPPTHGEVQRAVAGMPFPSFYLFAFFSLAYLRSLPTANQIVAPEANFRELQSRLSAWENVRTGNAHGLYQPSRRQRETFFELIDRWFASLVAACPERLTREELLELTEPLPIVNPDGTVSWSIVTQ